MENLETFSKIFSKLDYMEKTGVIDESINLEISDLIDEFSSSERFWIDNEKVSIQTAFIMFRASRNAAAILKKAKARFSEAKSSQENPKVALDFRKVIYQIYELYNKLEEAREHVPNVDFILANQVQEDIRHLRQIAKQTNMLPSLKEEIAGLNKKQIEKEFSELDARILAGFMIG